MYKKHFIITSILSLILFIVILVFIVGGVSKEDLLEQSFLIERIEKFSCNYFRFLDNINIDETNANYIVIISFVPEVGSFPIKEDIYKEIANHALQIITFFPEVNEFEYVVLSNYNPEQIALKLTIDEVDAKNLSDKIFNIKIEENGGFRPSYRDIFSSITETDESKSWRDIVDPNADIP